MFAVFRTLLFTIIFYIGCIPTVLAAGLSTLFGTNAIIAASRNWAKWHRFCARWILGVRSQVVGELPQGPSLVVLKHESMFETIELLVLFDRPCVVMKAELMDIPVWGKAARDHGSIPVDREAGASAMRRMLTAARAAKESGRPVVIFAEGTRIPHGECPPLRPGFAGLYKMCGLPVVPIALDAGKIWPRSFAKHAGLVTFLVGEQIPTGLPREEVEARVHKAINALNR